MSLWLESDFPSSRLRHNFSLRRELPLESDETITAFRDGEVTLRSARRTDGFTEAVQETGYQRVLHGDLVVHAMDAFAGAVGVSQASGKCSPVCQVLVPTRFVDPRYYAYVLREAARAGYLQSLARGIRERSTDLRWAQARNLVVPAPPLARQQAITEFLDRERVRIGDAVTSLTCLRSDAKRALDAAAEERIAGLSADVPVRKLSWDVTLLGGFAFSSADFVHDSAAGMRLVRGVNVTPSGLRWDDTVFWPRHRLPEVERFALREGDLLIGLNRPWVRDGLRAAIVTRSDLPALLLQRVACLRPIQGGRLTSSYVRLCIRTSDFRHSVGDASAVTFPMLEPGRLLAYRVPVPALDTQHALVREFEARASVVDALDREIKELTDGLDAYFQGLVFESLTGGLNVGAVSDAQMVESLSAVREGERPEVLSS